MNRCGRALSHRAAFLMISVLSGGALLFATEAAAEVPPPPAGDATPAVLPLQAPTAAAPPEAPVPAAPKPPPYSLPWQLRPVLAKTVLRAETAFAFMKDPRTSESGNTAAMMLLGSYAITPELAPMVRLGLVANSPPGAAPADVAIVNPVLGATYSLTLPAHLKLAFFLAVAVPIGMGSGDTPAKSVAAASRSGILARSAMDNAMFAVNDFTIFPGIDLAYVNAGFTAQAEVTLLQLFRVDGGGGPVPPNKDATKTNFTAGLHLGYFILPQLSLSGEIRYQRWLSTPAAVAADKTGASRDNLTFAVGPRLHFKLGQGVWFRPGIAYARGLDNPMSASGYNIVQLDLPFLF